MCARFSLNLTVDEIRKYYRISRGESDPYLIYNIPPRNKIPIVFLEGSEHVLSSSIWGWTPAWANRRSMPVINARAEEIVSKPMFKKGLANGRCLVPATGFFEWSQEGPSKQPYHFRLTGGVPFAFAGLMNVAAPENECLILTTSPNSVVVPIHDRMPVILTPDRWENWLCNDVDNALGSILVEFPPQAMEAYLVTKKMGNVRYDGEDSILPLVPDQGTLF